MNIDEPSSEAQASIYRLVVKSADEAVRTIRERFGPQAKVLSVKQVEGQGILGMLTRPKLEVVVQVEAEEARVVATAPAPKPVPAPRLPVPAPDAMPNHSPAVSTIIRPAKGTVEEESLPPKNLEDLLRRSGFSETFLAQLQILPSWRGHADRPLHVSLADLGRELRRMFSTRKARELPPRSVFFGMRGSGTSTALCKWLGAEVFARGHRGRVLKVDFDQPNTSENLNIYCEALGLGVEHYFEGMDLEPAPGEFLYGDLPGFSIRHSADNRALQHFLASTRMEGRVLVLNALHDSSTLREAYSLGRNMGATHLVYTHCDEVRQWGKLMDFLIDGELTPLFLANGPSLSGDCMEDFVGELLRRTIPGA